MLRTAVRQASLCRRSGGTHPHLRAACTLSSIRRQPVCATPRAPSSCLSLRPSGVLLHGGGHRHPLDEDAQHEQADTSSNPLRVKVTSKLDKKQMEHECTSITMYGVYSNIALAAFKLVGGIAGNSMAMVADAVHSLSDLITDAITLWAARLTHKPQDADHPYGHGKFEAIGTLSISVTLAGTAAGIAYTAVESIQSIIDGQSLDVPTGIALVAAVVSIAVKEVLYHATLRVGTRWNSKVVKANAWHHRSDSISTLVAMFGVLGAMVKLPILDPIAGLFVSGLILKAACELGWDALRDLSDENVDARVLTAVAGVLTGMKSEGVLHHHRLRGRAMGPFILMDVHVSVDPTISVSAAHQIAERARIKVRQRMPVISEFMVHVELGELTERTVFEDLSDDQNDRTLARATEPQLLTAEHVREVLQEYDTARAHKLAISNIISGQARNPQGSSETASAASHSTAASSISAQAATHSSQDTAASSPQSAASAAASAAKSTFNSLLEHATGKSTDDGKSASKHDQEGSARSSKQADTAPHLDLSKLMRPQAEIERDVRRALAHPSASFASSLLGVSHFTAHWLKNKLTIQLELAFKPDLTIRQAQELARDIDAHIRQQVTDVHKVDLHLELTQAHVARASGLAPPVATDTNMPHGITSNTNILK